MIGLLALVAAALADPAALRAPGSPDFAAELGTPSASLAYWRGSRGIGAWARLDGGSLGAVLALRHEPTRLGPVAHVATGILASAPRAALGLHASVAAGLGLTTGSGGHRLQIVVPVSAAAGDVRVPVLLEGASAFGIGRWSLGGRAAVGAVSGSTRPSLALQAGLVVARRSGS